jgi:glycosyltransferase involved in cell wall biosynthesis
MFCYEDPQSVVGQFAGKTARNLAQRGIEVHIFSRRPMEALSGEIRVHPVGSCDEGDLIAQVNQFTRRACNSFLRVFRDRAANVTLMGHEWSTIPSLSLLHGIKNIGAVLSLHSVERQRGGQDTGIGKWIAETELAGIREARSIIVHDPSTAEIVGSCVPESVERMVDARSEIPMAGFEFDVDPGEVKQRFEVGPVDPTVLYVGDLDDRYGPTLLMKGMARVLRQRPQARCIFVGDGPLLWPLRVYSRYLLLDHAVRLVGHLPERGLYELIHAADVIVVPSVEATPWWPIEAAWAAGRPVVATAESAPLLLEDERNCLVVDPNEGDLAAGIERILSYPGLGRSIAERGKAQLEDRYSEEKVIAQIEAAIGVEVSA